jgi:hypothetical protein
MTTRKVRKDKTNETRLDIKCTNEFKVKMKKASVLLDMSMKDIIVAACNEYVRKQFIELGDSQKDKVCSACGEIKPLTDYARSVKRPAWSSPKCKSCKAIYDKERHSNKAG